MDKFTEAYIEALLWADCGPDSECSEAHLSDFAPETIKQIESDCAAFQAVAKRSLDLAYDYATKEYNEASAGHDFWLTRNGHGAGFWDRGLGAVGDQLTKDAKTFGELSPYWGDDGRIYLG